MQQHDLAEYTATLNELQAARTSLDYARTTDQTDDAIYRLMVAEARRRELLGKGQQAQTTAA